MQLLTVSCPKRVPVFTDPSVCQFRKLVTAVRRHGSLQITAGRGGWI